MAVVAAAVAAVADAVRQLSGVPQVLSSAAAAVVQEPETELEVAGEERQAVEIIGLIDPVEFLDVAAFVRFAFA